MMRYDDAHQTLYCEGDWDLAHLKQLQQSFQALDTGSEIKKITIDGSAITKMDSAGAWLLNQFIKRPLTIHLVHFSEPHSTLLNIVQKDWQTQSITLPKKEKSQLLAHVGKTSVDYFNQSMNYFTFIGKLTMEAGTLFSHPGRIRWPSFTTVIYRTGFQALPIMALLSFMIGVVLTYQLGLQLRSYGADIYIVNLLGLAILREFAPLLTAIMVAGRTGSAYTAQLGMMTLNQEIDALNTMGVTPGELLLLPRIIGLIIALPLLTMWSDIFGILGGIVMSNKMLGISWYDFLHRFPHVITLSTFVIGLAKTPVYALIIAIVGCYEGMTVEQNADSIGTKTTRSVVLSIFLIIVVDAFFSIILSLFQL